MAENNNRSGGSRSGGHSGSYSRGANRSGGSRSGNSRGGSSRRGYGANHGGNRGGNSRSGDRSGGYRGNNRRYERNDGESRYEHNDGERRFNRSNRNSSTDNYSHNSDSRNGNRGGYRGNHADDRRSNSRSNGSERRNTSYHNRGNHQGRQTSKNYDAPRINSDGTVSFPSQNPYTDRRPGEPKMPKGLEWSMLSTDEKERLRGLSKEHAENIGLHMLAAYALEEDNPQAALAHAEWIAKQASRVDIARETLALITYRQGDYKRALREFRTVFRMNGYGDYLPFMADCERGLGNPQKAVDIALSDDAKKLRGESKAEMFLVYAGALADLDLFDKAIEVCHTLAHSKGVGGAYRMRAVQAEQNFLEQAGHSDEAEALNPLLDELEEKYADADEEDMARDIVDNDLERIDDETLRGLGIDVEEYYDEDDDEYGYNIEVDEDAK